MYLCEDELLQLRAELVADDHTSCTSSLATTISVGLVEDTDELYLGAEANSFFGYIKKNVFHTASPETTEKSSSKLRNGGYLLAMKELYNSLESVHTHRTCSSMTKISSVSDLLEAREVNPSEILAGLGFVNNSEEIYRREVLSRFAPSSLLSEKDNRFLDPRGDISNPALAEDQSGMIKLDEMRTSIHKTQEWLSQYHENDTLTCKPDLNKSSGLESKKSNLSKAIRARRKFTKSRQSSFDLLPKLKEDSREGDSPTSKEHSKQLAALLDATIQESFKERDDVTMNEIAPDLTRHELEQPVSATTNSSSPSDFGKTSLPKSLSIRMESFEMEEINSVNGDTSDGGRLRLLALTDLMNEDATLDSSPQSELCQKFADDDPSDENETSSGFDEDDVNTTPSKTISTSTVQNVKPHAAFEPEKINPVSTSFNSPVTSSRFICDSDETSSANQLESANCNDSNNNKVKILQKSSNSCTNCVFLPEKELLPSDTCLNSSNVMILACDDAVVYEKDAKCSEPSPEVSDLQLRNTTRNRLSKLRDTFDTNYDFDPSAITDSTQLVKEDSNDRHLIS